jgi:hypothetical protein
VDGGDKPGHEGKEHSELVIASVSEAIQRFVLSVECFVAFAPRNDGNNICVSAMQSRVH